MKKKAIISIPFSHRTWNSVCRKFTKRRWRFWSYLKESHAAVWSGMMFDFDKWPKPYQSPLPGINPQDLSLTKLSRFKVWTCLDSSGCRVASTKHRIHHQHMPIPNITRKLFINQFLFNRVICQTGCNFTACFAIHKFLRSFAWLVPGMEN